MILLFAAPLARFIPLAVLAAILMVVAYNMGEWREIPAILKLTKTDISVWLVTFALTVFADLTVAVEAGMIMAALLFISKVAATTTVSQVTDEYMEDGRAHILQDKDIPHYVTHLSDSWAVSVWSDGQNRGGTENMQDVAAGSHFAAAQYDGARCDWAVCD